jgi:AcrR family transcriptional regulator
MSVPAHVDPRVRRTRQALMDATWTLIENRAGSDVSVTEIAREAGVSRQALYQHYPDRDALLADAAVQRMDEAVSQSGARTTERRIGALLSYLRTSDSFYRPILAASAAGFYQHLEDNLADLIGNVLRSPQLDAPVRPEDVGGIEALARFMAGGIVAFIRRWLAQPAEEAVSPAEAARQLRRIMDPFIGSSSSPVRRKDVRDGGTGHQCQ